MSEATSRTPEDEGLIDCLSCPFCGIDDKTVMEVGCERGDGWRLLCENCGAQGPFADDKLAAQHAWNRTVTRG